MKAFVKLMKTVKNPAFSNDSYSGYVSDSGNGMCFRDLFLEPTEFVFQSLYFLFSSSIERKDADEQ